MTVIAIAGGSCSGKTSLSNDLEQRLTSAGIKTAVLHMDSYFKNPTPTTIAPITGIEYPEHNHPDSLHMDRLIADLKAAADDEQNRVVIVEGLFALYEKAIRDMADIKIFVDLKSDERLIRRIIKFGKMRGDSMETVAARYLDTVRFRHDELVEPTRWHADLVLNGHNWNGTGISVLMDSILKLEQ